MTSKAGRTLTTASKSALAAFGTVAVVSVLVFWSVEILPQDAAISALGQESTPAQREAFREERGLNRPALDRYLSWAGGVLTGDFGTSVASGRPIARTLFDRLENTAILTLGAVILSLALALPAAVAAARRPGRFVDLAISSVALAISAVPEYVIAIILLMTLGSQLGLFPIVSTGISDGDLAAYVMPLLTLALVAGSYVYKLARESIAEALAATYVRTAVLNGLSPRRVFWRHVLPNASGVLVNVVALNVLYLFGGVIVVEYVFAYPGLGSLLVEAIAANDVTVIEAIAVVTAALFVAVNIAADSLVTVLDPRRRSAQ